MVYGPENKVKELSKNGEFIVLGEVDVELNKQRLWWMTIVVIVGTISLAAPGTDADREKRNAWCYMFTSFENIDTSGMLSIIKLAGYCTYFRSNSCGNCDTKTGTAVWIENNYFPR